FNVTAYDSFGNVATGYVGTIHFTSSDSQAVLPADTTMPPTSLGSFNFTATLKTAGSQNIKATDMSNSNVTRTPTGNVVQPLHAVSLAFNGYAASVATGTPVSFTLAAIDPYGNTDSAYTGTVHFTSSDTAAGLPADYTFNATDAGDRTFNAVFNTTGTE